MAPPHGGSLVDLMVSSAAEKDAAIAQADTVSLVEVVSGAVQAGWCLQLAVEAAWVRLCGLLV